MTRSLRSTALLGSLVVALLAAFVLPTPVAADGGGGGGGTERTLAPSKPEDPDYTAAVKAIKANEFAKAIPLLEGVVSRDAKNADAYNWLAYATRKNGNPAGAIPLYEKALAIDPKHRGAHEYIGEAYLMLDDLPKAKQHLSTLDSLCLFSCSEYRDLKRAVEAYEKSGGKSKPTASSKW
jgi:tetratricopeptide (TPR) repeat protein